MDNVAERSLWWYVGVLLRWRRLIIMLPFVAVAGSVMLAFLRPRQYVASASFVPQESSGASLVQTGLGQLASQFGLAAPRAQTASPQFYAQLLQSREVLREVVNTVYDVGGEPPFRGTLVAYFEIRAPDSTSAVIRAVEELRGVLSVRTDRAVGITRFEVHTRNRELTERMAERFLELLNAYNLEHRQAQARAEREFVEQRLAQARVELGEAEDALAAFYARNRQYRASPDLVAKEGRLQRRVTLEGQLYVSLAQSYGIAQVEELRNTPLIMIVERPAGFVEPVGRGLRVLVLSVSLVGFLVAVAIALTTELMRQGGKDDAAAYQEMRNEWRVIQRGLPRWLAQRFGA